MKNHMQQETQPGGGKKQELVVFGRGRICENVKY